MNDEDGMATEAEISVVAMVACFVLIGVMTAVFVGLMIEVGFR